MQEKDLIEEKELATPPPAIVVTWAADDPDVSRHKPLTPAPDQLERTAEMDDVSVSVQYLLSLVH